MKLGFFKNQKDKIIKDNQTYKVIVLSLSLVVMFLTYVITFRIEDQKIVVMPPFVTLKEFWVSGDNVSDTYLEMVADGVAYNVLNIAPERKPNTEFLYAMVPAEHYKEVRSAIDNQIKFIQNNAVSQVFYTTEYNLKEKGIIKVSGLLKQYIGDKKMESSIHTLEIGYFIKGGKFFIRGIQLTKDGTKNIKDEDAR